MNHLLDVPGWSLGFCHLNPNWNEFTESFQCLVLLLWMEKHHPACNPSLPAYLEHADLWAFGGVNKHALKRVNGIDFGRLGVNERFIFRFWIGSIDSLHETTERTNGTSVSNSEKFDGTVGNRKFIGVHTLQSKTLGSFPWYPDDWFMGGSWEKGPNEISVQVGSVVPCIQQITQGQLVAGHLDSKCILADTHAPYVHICFVDVYISDLERWLINAWRDIKLHHVKWTIMFRCCAQSWLGEVPGALLLISFGGSVGNLKVNW